LEGERRKNMRERSEMGRRKNVRGEREINEGGD